MNWLSKVFSGNMSMARLNLVGVALMLVGVVLNVLAGRFKEKLNPNIIRVIALLICASGVLLAILG